MAFIPLYDTNPLRRIRHPYVMWGFLAANVLAYFLLETGGVDGEAGHASMIQFGLIPSVFSGIDERPVELSAISDTLTLVTYSFLHADFWHLAGNMIFLWVLGDNVEDALGHFRYFIFYILCAVAAGYVFILSDPTSQAPIIGASGAIAGNIAAYLILYPRAKIWVLIFLRIPLRLRGEYVLGFWIAFQFFSAFYGSGADEVAWWAHVGGLVAGAVLVVFMRQKGVPLFAKALPEPGAAPQPALDSRPSEPPTEQPRSNEEKGPWG